jgi:lipopolysaccharide/colanic/teichoic acid biosynthesis glycosyltransferase
MIRLTDIVASLFALLALSPLLLLTAFLLRFTGEGDVFFLQNRIGKNGDYFSLIKFASMLRDSASTGTGELTLKNDARVLPVGRILRKLKINEIPQLINVLKGDMSLIGYRPQTKKYWDCFTPAQQQALARYRPGLSGMSSILLRDEEAYLAKFADPIKADETLLMPFKGRVEEWWVNNITYSNYVKLIVLTVIKVVLPNSTLSFSLIKKMSSFQTELDDILNAHARG